jgi:D-alanyl-D-alanine carboxypeptidase
MPSRSEDSLRRSISIQTSSPRPSVRVALGLTSLAAALLALVFAAGPAAAKPLPRADRAYIDAQVAELMKAERLPGLSLEVSGPKGDYTRTYGVADLKTEEPYRADQHVRIASITKTFTATAILRQVAEGKLGLDQTIDRWFKTVPNADEITVRDLLAMRSGLYDFTADPQFLKEFTADPRGYFNPRDVVEIVSSHKPVADPDTETKYTDANYVLLGLILEKVSGLSAEKAITDDVIKPLGLKHTSFPTTAKMPKPSAHGYYAGEDGKGRIQDYTAVNPKYAWTAGAMVSTLGDLHKYARELATGKLLPKWLWNERQRFGTIPNPGIPVGYGLGLLHVGNWLGHDGAIFGFSTVTMYEPEHGETISATANLSSNFSTPTLALFGEIAKRIDPDSLKASPQPTPAQQREAKIADGIEKTMAEEGIPGAIVGVWQKGKEPFERGFGVADKKTGAPMSPDLFMRIGSETKTFTGTAVLQLVKEGKVGLDNPISDYLPGVPNGQNITVRELGEMRSGLLSYSANEQWALKLFANPHQQWDPEELLSYGFSEPPLFAPGTQFNYSNTNTILLGLLVEKISGETLESYVEKHLLKPLGMDNTRFPHAAEFPSPHAQGYTTQTLDGKETTSTDWNPSWGWAAGAMISDLHDLRIWARSVATGTLLNPAVQAEREKFIPAEDLEPAEYGFALFDVNGWIGHNGSLPGYQSLTVYSPKLKTTMVILLNSDIDPANGNELSTEVGKAITKVIAPKNVFYFLPGGQKNPAK